MRIELDSQWSAPTGHLGRSATSVIDPRRRTLTHLVVEPHHRHHLARLVPIGDIDQRGGSVLRMTLLGGTGRAVPGGGRERRSSGRRVAAVGRRVGGGRDDRALLPFYDNPGFGGMYRPMSYDGRVHGVRPHPGG